MFVVCVYNVSPDQPYTVFKAPVSSTAQDIITQVGYRLQDIITQVGYSTGYHNTGRIQHRIS